MPAQKGAGTSAENFSFISKMAVNLLYQYNNKRGARKVSMKQKEKMLAGIINTLWPSWQILYDFYASALYLID
jgi:hypothetical protein